MSLYTWSFFFFLSLLILVGCILIFRFIKDNA